MNDRFKFRAWNPERNDFIYNIQDVGSDFSIRCLEDCFGDFLFNEDYIIEQCTGLKDKNGRLIYENDILQDCEQKIIVVFDNERHCFMFKYQQTHAYKPICCLDVLDGDFEIIGNIHTDKKLLDFS